MFDITKFVLRFPEFEDAEPALVELLAADAIAIIGDDPKRWCGNYEPALAYLTAHFLTLRQRQAAMSAAGAGGQANASGPITSKTAHAVSVTYAQPSSGSTKDELFYQKTAYGEQFLIYRQQCFGVSTMVATDTAGCGKCSGYGINQNLLGGGH